MSDIILIPYEKANDQEAKHFDALLWLFKSVSTDPLRGAIYQSFSVSDGICCATDGHRMHLYSQKSDRHFLADGQYKIESASKKQIIISIKANENFPDVWNLLNYKPKNGIPYFYGYKEDINYSKFLYHVYKHTTLVNETLLRDAYIPKGRVDFERMGDAQTSGIVFGNEHQIAVVMPLRIE